ncbi:hypothetical protein [Actinomadura sp. HBU206391]|uniref:hypothetical protein n=1 Tax=Actinomadura sp. HBU206391 TaxID=2731692 RepID=UPI001650C1E4|nr:hypothetical protein [Actinomadura sp. HBU206391]MBC6462369.1 hypothetical protein [Actinomadura sp. HBU206391]
MSDTSSPMRTRQTEEDDFWPEEKRRAPRKLLIGIIAAVLVVIIAVVVVVVVSGGDDKGSEAGIGAGTPPTVWVGTGASSGTVKLNLRSADQRPLNPGEVFTDEVKTVTHGKYSFNLVGSHLTNDCLGVAWGVRLRNDLRKYGCSQVARGAYLSADKRHAGQFIALNLDRLEGADQIVRDLDPQTNAGFVMPLKAAGVSNFGSGFSAAYGQPFGHYVIVSWVQRNGGGQPDSMNELLDASVAIEGADDFVWQRLILAGG